ncbi:MAG: antibiotic biosynthesis monooxygenase family protein [Candidatus Phaeomarinobacter sp.]
MFIAMNRFKIRPGREQDFETIWRERDSFLEDLPGFKAFHLMQGPSSEDHTLYASHTVWNSREDFEAWTKSEAFRKAHKGAGSHEDIYLGHPNFEGFEEVDGTEALALAS